MGGREKEPPLPAASLMLRRASVRAGALSGRRRVDGARGGGVVLAVPPAGAAMAKGDGRESGRLEQVQLAPGGVWVGEGGELAPGIEPREAYPRGKRAARVWHACASSARPPHTRVCTGPLLTLRVWQACGRGKRAPRLGGAVSQVVPSDERYNLRVVLRKRAGGGVEGERYNFRVVLRGNRAGRVGQPAGRMRVEGGGAQAGERRAKEGRAATGDTGGARGQEAPYVARKETGSTARRRVIPQGELPQWEGVGV